MGRDHGLATISKLLLFKKEVIINLHLIIIPLHYIFYEDNLDLINQLRGVAGIAIYRQLSLVIFLVMLVSCGCKKQISEPDNISATSHDYNWTIDSLVAPDALQLNIRSLWGANENDVWAVGHSDLVRYQVWHWDGAEWEYRYTPLGLSYSIRSIFGFSDNDIWFVGTTFNQDPLLNLRGFVAHFNGTEWTLIDDIDVPSCHSVWGTSSQNLFVGCDSGKVLHHDGNLWLVQKPGTLYSSVISMWGLSTNDVYAIGTHIDFVQPHDSTYYYFYQYTGQSWQVLEEVVDQPLNPSLAFGTFLWGTGDNQLFSAGVLGLFKYVNKGWEIIDSFEPLRRIHGSNWNNIFVGGFENQVHHFNGESWHTYDELIDESRWISAILVLDNSVFLSSSTGTDTKIIHGVISD